MSEVGRAYISILPSARGFAANLQREIGTDIAKAGTAGGKDYGAAFGTAVTREASGPEMAKRVQRDMASGLGKAGKAGGEDYGDGFKTAATRAAGDASIAKRVQRTLASAFGRAGRDAGQEFGEEFSDAAESSADDAADGMASKLKAGLAAAGIGAVIAASVGESMERSALSDKLAVQLGGTRRMAKRHGEVASQLYAGAWGESMEDVNNAVASVATSIGGMRRATKGDLHDMTASVLDFATAFEIDTTRAAQVAGQMVRTGLARDGGEALDLLFASMQRVPAAVREDVLDAIDEYGPFFRSMGMDGEKAMSMLVEGAEKGMYGIDKTGDAVKEFTIRATDMSDATQTAYEKIGLNADDMTDTLLAGGNKASRSFDKIVNGLLSIEDPGERANTAIALFGTPLEDLSVNEIPGFLRGLRSTENRLGKVAGTATRAGKQLNDNAATKFTEFKRSVQTGFVNFVGNTLIPAAEDLWTEIGPSVRRFGRAIGDLGEDLGPVAKDVLPVFADTLGAVAKAVGSLATQFSKLPPALQTALVTGGLFAVARGRMRGGGMLGTAASLLTAGMIGKRAAPAAAGGAAARTAAAAAGASVGSRALSAGRTLARRGGYTLLAERTATTGYDIFKSFNDVDTLQQKLSETDATAKGLRQRFHLIGAALAESNIGRYAEDTGVNVDRLALSMAKYGSKGEYVQQVIKRLQNQGDSGWNRWFNEAMWGNAGDDVTRTGSALEDFNNVVDNAGVATRRQTQRQRDANKAAREWATTMVTKCVPTARDLADEFGINARKAETLREQLAFSAENGAWSAEQLRKLAKSLGLTREETQALIVKYGNLTDSQRVGARTARAHENGLDGMAEQMGLTDRKAQRLTEKILDQEGANRQAKGESQLHEKQLRQVAEQLGLTRDQTQRLIERYRDVPKDIRTTAWFDDVDARGKIRDFRTFADGKFRELGDSTYAIMVNGTSGHGRLFEADGGIVKYAHGGVEDHVAQIAKPGTTRVWNEPETGGELYAPLSPTKRPRSRKIMEQGARLMGGRVEWYQDGGITAKPRLRVQADMSELRQMVRETVQQIRQSMAGGMTSAQIERGQAAARSQVGKPYVWGGVGPGGYDCSGFQSYVYNTAVGKPNPYVRLGTTATMPWPMMQPGKGAYTVGWFTGDPGHVSGNIGGLNVESTGDHVRVGAAARSPQDPLFDRIAHFTSAAGRRFAGGGRGGEYDAGSARGIVRNAAAAYGWDAGAQWRALANIIQRESSWNPDAQNGNARGLFQKMTSVHGSIEPTVAGQARWGLSYIANRYRTPLGALAYHNAHGNYDSGGWLMPGAAGTNLTRKPEAVLDPDESRGLKRLAGALGDQEPRRRGPLRIELDVGGGRVLTGVVRDEIAGEAAFNATTGRMRG